MKRTIVAALCVLLFVAVLLPAAAHAQGDSKTVRVGWYESPFNMTDDFGRRSGYAYEYQRKIAAYTGWNYEYIEGSWPELLQMLIDGEIDLMSDISYTPERAELMQFSSLPMGAEEYYIFTAPDNTDIRQEDPHSLDGKRIGVDKGSVQMGLYRTWAAQRGVEAEMVELTGTEYESVQKMLDGEIDAFLTLDAYGNETTTVPKFKVGSSDFFFAVSDARSDLLEELNTAMSRIQDENRYYNQQMSNKYITTTGASLFLSEGEQDWLSAHGAIRVGYEDDLLAFCAADENGALKEYLDAAADCLANAHLEFEPVAYPTVGAALEALKNGDVDCVFPSELSTSDGEARKLVLTPAVMSTDLYTVVRRADRDAFTQTERPTVALPEDDPDYESIMMDQFPTWQTAVYPDTGACLRAVAEGKADCVLISNYQFNSLSSLMELYDLTMLATGKDVEFTMAVNLGDNALYSILTRMTNLVSDTTVNAALNYYSAREAAFTVADFIRANPVLVGAVVVAVVALLAIVLIQHRLIVARREADESQHRVESLSRQVYVDALTQVRNKGGYDNYILQLQERMDQGEAIAVAVGVFDCDNLKGINDQYGHDKGNLYLQNACRLICNTFQHSPVFRVGGDEFTAVLTGEDYENRDAIARQFEAAQQESRPGLDRWEQPHVSFGLAVYDPQRDSTLGDLIRRADRMMYDNKRARKGAR